jgi:hypothetical protein
LATLDPPCQPPAVAAGDAAGAALAVSAGDSPGDAEAFPPAGARRWLRVVITAAAVGAAVAVVLTGPPRPATFQLRLPLLVLLTGAAWTALPALRSRWSRLARATAGRRAAVPMATPWLILTSTAGVAVLTLKLLTADPALYAAVFAVGAAICCLAIGVCVTGGRRGGTARPDDADSLLGGVPGEAVGAVGVDAGRELGVEDDLAAGAELGDGREVAPADEQVAVPE